MTEMQRTVGANKSINLINKKRLVETFFELAKIKSPSRDEKQIADYISGIFQNLGLTVITDNAGEKIGSNTGNIIVVLPSNYENDAKRIPPLFFGAHLDTVSVNGEIKPGIRNEKIVNKNKNCILGADDKVAVAAIIEAIRTIKDFEIKTGDIYLIFTIAEEAGLLGSRNMNLKPLKAKYGFLFDGVGDIGTIFSQAPFHNAIDITIIGKAAHAGISPEKGINAIQVASYAISNMKLGKIEPGTVCNIGIIEGGVATNIIPEKVEIKAEARSLTEEKLEKLTDQIVNDFVTCAKKNGAKAKFKVKREYNGFKIAENDLPVIMAKNVFKKLGIKPKIISTVGGSDVNILNSRGKIAIILSAGMENVHSCKEYVKIKELEKLTAFIIELCVYKK
ncbi:MAG: M20/M25/M40 family metallo-hydrolase [Actinobacteria bacterium]|nr:M20/M25/M40 family metallo-hydrolase [Actinomycetota bacterium]MCL5073421.1 M20/M25/M40 family metallo-hydrolase [Actinomycetota bacterium]